VQGEAFEVYGPEPPPCFKELSDLTLWLIARVRFARLLLDLGCPIGWAKVVVPKLEQR
jgi:hypothetical protein